MLLVALPRLNLGSLMVIRGFISLWMNLNQVESVFDIVEGMRYTNATKLAANYLKSKPEVEEIINERYVGATPNLDILLEYSEESLGYIYASHMKKLGFTPASYRKIKIEDDISYILFRMRQTHDIWHVITGFDTSQMGELGIQSFSLAQTRLPMPVILLAGGLFRTIFQSPELLGNLLEQVTSGYTMGSKVKPLFAQKWEENWEKPLSEWREELGINLVNTCVSE